MVSTLYVARHGLRANEEPCPTGIDGDVRLSAEGEFQSQELAALVSKLNPPIDCIISSPFYRCLQTITPGAKLLKKPIFVEPGFGEHYHVNRPTHPIPLVAAKSKPIFPAIDTSYEPILFPSKDGETRSMLRERVKQALNKLLDKFASVPTLLIVTHAAVKITIAEILCGTESRAGTASLDRLERSETGWKLVQNGDVSHLSGGEQMHWDFGMAFEAGSVEDEASRKHPASDDTVKVYVPIDFSGQPKSLSGIQKLSFADLSSDQPLIKADQAVYEGEWQDIVGTELYVSEDGQPIGKATQRIVLSDVETDEKPPKLMDRLKQIDEQRKR